MTVRRHGLALLAAAVLGFVAGCSGGDSVPLAVETDEPLHVQGLQQKKQGRNSEALVSFLKVIEKRGEQASAESHFEAGFIYLTHIKDYIEAIHHFQKYLELKPNSPQAPHVRDLVNTAKREFARSLPARPPEDQPSVRLEDAAQIDQLRRENAELRASLATLQGGGAAPINRAPRGLLLPEPARSPVPVAPPDESPISMAPARSPGTIRPSNQLAAVPTPTRSSAPAPGRPAAASLTSPGGRSYVVKTGDTLYSIAAKQLGSGRRVDELKAANRDILPEGTAIRPGMTIRLP